MPNFGYNPFSGSGLGFRAPGQGAPVGGPLVFDTFTDTNGTLLTAHTPDTDKVGGGWIYALGTWDIQNNRVGQADQASQWYAAGIDAGANNVDVTVTVYVPASGAHATGSAVRATSGNTCWYIIASDASGGKVVLGELNAGVNTARAEAAVTWDRGGSDTIRVVASGTTITVYVNGTEEVSYSSATFNQSATAHGLSGFRSSTVQRVPTDDFTVEAA